MITDEELRLVKAKLDYYQVLFAENGDLPHMQLLKKEHCLRVAENSLHIAQQLGKTQQQQNFTEAIGLLHDVARFQQWKQYGTFSDKLSEDHGELGVKILEQTVIIDHLSTPVQDDILHAVRFHNKKDIPTSISAEKCEQLRILREADRLDIILVILLAIEDGEIYQHPQILWNADLQGMASPIVRHCLEQGESINYAHLKTMSDWVLLHLQWIEQLYFQGSSQLVKSRNYLGRLHKIIPDTSKEVNACFSRVRTHLQQ